MFPWRLSITCTAHAVQFGYTRKDVILLGVGILSFGYALYYGLQAAGYDALVAGNIVQIFIFLGIGVGYISTYIFRVANKVFLWHHVKPGTGACKLWVQQEKKA
jgi:hypothetical protein